MKRTLYLKLLIGYVLLGIVAIFLIFGFTEPLLEQHEIKKEAEDLHREATSIAQNYGLRYLDKTYTASIVQNNIEALSDYHDTQIIVITPEGNLLMDSEDETILERALADDYENVEAFDITDFGNKTYLIDDMYGIYEEPMLFVYSTITMDYKVMAYVVELRDTAKITDVVNGYINIIYTAFVIFYAASFIILIFFGILVYRPIRKITKTANAFAKGDFTVKTDLHSNDEIGYLANTLNFMADELNRQEEDQRKFVSNVSHDFRSPLTSIKGYVEAILDGTIPPEMQDKYLNVILSETERLTKLTQSLLDLNRFGKHDIRLDIADFDLNGIIKNTLLTFEGTCLKNEITFDLVLTGESLFVHADMSKIQQVLYNLIDNAIKFSPRDSSIKIETSIKKDKVFVSVKDHGIGIPEDSIKKIWERFYKTDQSRGKDKKGTGLGLAIVKEIITAHKQNINVISTEGVGTEFIFTLALAERSLTDEE